VAGACVLCGYNDGPLTDEHVWPDWIATALDVRERTGNYYIAGEPGTPPRLSWHGEPFQAVVNVLCWDCNHHLGEVLESPASVLLKPMIAGKQTQMLRPHHQALLSSWALKTALMMDHFCPNPRLIPDDEYAMFYKREQPQQGRHQIWITARDLPFGTDDSPWATTYKQPVTHVELSPYVASQLPLAQWINEGRVMWRFTIAIGCVVFQVFGHNVPTLVNINTGDAPVTKIWPVGRRFRWPAHLIERDEGALNLHRAFNPAPGRPRTPFPRYEPN
jgi:hypothetical protein